MFKQRQGNAVLKQRSMRCFFAGSFLLVFSFSVASSSLAAEPASFEKDVLPILKAKCVRCHSDKQQKAELNLISPAGLLRGGESGEVLVAGRPEKSLLYEMIVEELMPPDEKDPLTKLEIETLRRWIAAGAKFETPVAAKAHEVDQHDVLPILLLRCTVCHGARKQEGGLDLRTKESLLKGGKSGPAIVLGKPEESLLLKKIALGEMPPKRSLAAVSVKTMAPLEVKTISRWIEIGAPESFVAPDVPKDAPDPLVSKEDRVFWSFIPPRAVSAPKVQSTRRVRTPIDAFILRKLESQGLTLAADAERATMIRRVYFDLLGLPPTPEEIERFLADGQPRAYERLIDRLLASPRYGERWARYWLDLAGYSDSEGVQHSDLIRPHAYRYRDYVIRAFNADKPYDRFLLEQIAGDELAAYEDAEIITQEIYDNLTATGFLRMAPDGTFSGITSFVPDRLEVIDDELETLTSSVMGLTMKCSRCHSHKFDPIPQRDYYRLASIFQGALDQHDWLKPTRQAGEPGENDRYLPYVTSEERNAWKAHQRNIQRQIEAVAAKRKKQQDAIAAEQLEKSIVKLPALLHADLRAMLKTPADKRTEAQNHLAEKFEKPLRISDEELSKINPRFKKAAEAAAAKTKTLEAEKKPEPLIRALWDRGEASPTYLLRRGDYLQPARLIGPGPPSVLNMGDSVFKIEPPAPRAKKTGRRLAFARWLVKKDHPLTARVMANRLWKHHFSAGIVGTLDNFGRTGSPPTHPELLDWLAAEFQRSGWSIKKLHRLIMASSVYRQSSQAVDKSILKDPENRLLSRMPLRRLEGESLRDTLLAVSEQLNTDPFGPPDAVEARADGLVVSAGGENGWRRSIYILQRRTQTLTILDNFDLPQMSPNCVERTESIVAPQALHLMNNAMVHKLSQALAKRIEHHAGDNRAEQIDRVYLTVAGRKPLAEEKQLAMASLQQLADRWKVYLKNEKNNLKKENVNNEKRDPLALEREAKNRALANFCHAMMNSAAMLYVD